MGSLLAGSGGWLPRSVSKVLVALIIALPGSASQLPSGSKVALGVLLGYTGCGAGERRSRPELGEVQPRCRALCLVCRAEVKNPAGTVLHSCASPSLPQRIAPQANSHPSACQSYANQQALRAQRWEGRGAGAGSSCPLWAGPGVPQVVRIP